MQKQQNAAANVPSMGWGGKRQTSTKTIRQVESHFILIETFF